jgi:hypothetical protein
MKAAIILRGLEIELVAVKGFNETLDNVDDHWQESRHAVFRKIQDHAHSAMLHFYSPTFAELATTRSAFNNENRNSTLKQIFFQLHSMAV